MQTVTQSWLVLELTGSPFKLGLIATLQSGPILLLSIFTGVLADRITRRTLLFVTQATQACLAVTLGLLAWSGHVRYWHVAVVAVLLGIIAATAQPARRPLGMELVGRQPVPSAGRLHSPPLTGPRTTGPAP